MRMDKLTTKFQTALAEAQSLAVGRDHQFIEPLHVLAALLDQDGGSTRPLLAKSDVNANALRSKIGQAGFFSPKGVLRASKLLSNFLITDDLN